VTRHGTEEEFELYVRGRLPQAQVTELEEHLLTCPACLRQVEEAERFVAAMREALQDEVKVEPAASRPRLPVFASAFRSRFAMAAMAIVLIAVVAGAFVYLRSGAHLAPVATIELTAVRGEMTEVEPARGFDLKLTDVPAGSFRVEVVDAVGSVEWEANAASRVGGMEVRVSRTLPSGAHFVRLYSAAGAMVHEYGFRVR